MEALSGLHGLGWPGKQRRPPTMLGSQLWPVIELQKQRNERLWRFDGLINKFAPHQGEE
jgi:hypothetical protein